MTECGINSEAIRTKVLDYQPRTKKRTHILWTVALYAEAGIIAMIWLLPLAFFIVSRFTVTGSDRRPSLPGTLAVLRGQIELFKIQHANIPPATSALVEVLAGRTHAADSAHTATLGTLGPYIGTMPNNPLNGNTAVSTTPGKGIGWVYTANGAHYEIRATDTTGTGLLPY